MVRRVFGKANGAKIIFEHQEGDWWCVTVPSNLQGEYIVDVYAEDEAGNVAYKCKMLFAICGHELQAYVLKTGYRAEMKEGGYSIECRICGG